MKRQGSLAAFEVNPRTVADRRASEAIRGLRAQRGGAGAGGPLGPRPAPGASSEVLHRARGVRAATEGREDSDSGALT